MRFSVSGRKRHRNAPISDNVPSTNDGNGRKKCDWNIEEEDIENSMAINYCDEREWLTRYKMYELKNVNA